MLNAIQVFLEKNRNWLFSFLLIIIVVPFVFTIGSMPGLVGGRKAKNLKLFGYNLNDQKQLEEVVRNGAISRVLQTGSEENAWMESAQGYAFYRLWLLSMARDLRLPTPSDAVLKTFIQSRPGFWDSEKKFDHKRYNTYLENWKQRLGRTYTLKALLVEDYLCEQVKDLIHQTEFVVPDAGKIFYNNTKANYTFDYIEVKNEEPLPDQVHANVVQAYYDEHKENYREDQRADVTLLFFDMKKYQGELPAPADAVLEAYFTEHKHQFKAKQVSPQDENTDTPKDAEPVFNDVKDAVRAAWETEQLTRLSEEAASQFVLQVYDRSILMESDAWKILVDTNDVRCIHSLAPFSKKSVPEKKGLKKSELLKAFDLNEDHFLSDSIPVKNGTILIALNKFLPSYIPDLDIIRERVLADTKEAEREKAFQKKVEDLRKNLDTSGAAPESYELKTLENFSAGAGIKDLFDLLEFKDVISFSRDLSTFKVKSWTKPYRGKKDSVFLFFCREKSCPEFDKTDPDYKAFYTNFLEQQQHLYSESLIREILETTMNN